MAERLGRERPAAVRPAEGTFESFPLPSASAGIRQLNGRPGQVWGAESTVNKLVVWQAR